MDSLVNTQTGVFPQDRIMYTVETGFSDHFFVAEMVRKNR